MNEETISQEQYLFNQLNFEERKSIIEIMEYIINLQQENNQLKEAINNFHYCPYDDKCGQLYDCTREEYQGMAESNTRLSTENSDLKDRIEKATKFIESVYDSLENVDRPIFFYENILKILKGEVN